MVRWILTVAVLLALSRSASATWSIVLVDQRTGEIGVASVTCLAPFDLLALTPVIRVERGAAVCQASGDFDGVRRPILWQGLIDEDPPSWILASVASVPGHSNRQYGIADVESPPVTFTGGGTIPVASGATGQVGDIVYAAQANIMVGACTVQDIVTAIEASDPTDLPAMLLAGMEAARATGGDSRCSCGTIPPSCGCPVPSFTLSGDIGYFVVARPGDSDDPFCAVSGCADGDYYLTLNYAFAAPGDPDPVDSMTVDFADFRQALVGVPDGLRSEVTVTPVAGGAELRVSLRDWEGSPVTAPVTFEIDAIAGSGLALFGAVTPLGGGEYSIPVTAIATGEVEVEITVDDGARSVLIAPRPRVCLGVIGSGASDCDGDGLADACAIAAGLVDDANGNGIPDGCEMPFRRGDCDADGVTAVGDAVFLLTYLFTSGEVPTCLSSCDIDDSSAIELVDVVYLLQNLFTSGPAIPPPTGPCGDDPTPDSLGCAGAAGC